MSSPERSPPSHIQAKVPPPQQAMCFFEQSPFHPFERFLCVQRFTLETKTFIKDTFDTVKHVLRCAHEHALFRTNCGFSSMILLDSKGEDEPVPPFVPTHAACLVRSHLSCRLKQSSFAAHMVLNGALCQHTQSEWSAGQTLWFSPAHC